MRYKEDFEDIEFQDPTYPIMHIRDEENGNRIEIKLMSGNIIITFPKNKKKQQYKSILFIKNLHIHQYQR